MDEIAHLEQTVWELERSTPSPAVEGSNVSLGSARNSVNYKDQDLIPDFRELIYNIQVEG
jgi:hypothetical protein